MLDEVAPRPPGLMAQARLRWLSEFEADPLLPERTVIVRNEATAHAWRRDAVALRPDLVIGTRFVTPIAAATAVLELAGATFSLGEDVVRAARVVALLAEDLEFQAFEGDVLRSGRGWGDAIASTLAHVEGATLELGALASSADPRCRDVALLLARLDEVAGSSWTMARVLREATTRLVAAPSLWPFAGACLVEVTGHETMAMAKFLRAIPRVRVVSIATQPRRSAYVERVRARFGELALQDIGAVTTSELGLLATYLFSAPEVLAAPNRPRSMGNDGTVQIEEHAGLDEELDAAVTWVIGEIGDCGTALEQIAIVVPQLDPYAALLAARLDALIPDSAHVLGGIPATGTSDGARIATALRALAGHLHIDVLAELLPILELPSDDLQLSQRDALAALYELGTVGGSAAHPAAALEWLARGKRRETTLAAELAGTLDAVAAGRDARALARKLEHLRAITPALEAIDRVARVLIADEALEELWPTLCVVLSRHLRVSGDGARIISALDDALHPLMGAGILRGEAALGAVSTALEALRLPVGRFGEPRVTIAALSDAAGLTFSSVRVLGLAEGSIPANVREDPVLPDAVRRELGSMPVAFDRTVAQLHALHRIALGTTERIVLSVARMDPQRRYREPSGALLEAAAALGRPPLGTGDLTIPDVKLLRRQAFEPAHRDLRTIRARWPVDARGRLDRAVRRRQVPKSWRADKLLSIDRLLAPVKPEPGPMDGWFPAGAFAELPGLALERPISASALARLLECPHRFLYERVLGWAPPPKPTDEGNIDALSYGSLFHETAEAFYRTHGAAFCAKSQPLREWQQASDVIADARFAAFIETYPLAGGDIRNAARRRLQRDLRALLASDWQVEKAFVDVERNFGPLSLPIGADMVHVHGCIDRIDTVGATTLVRDLKTGRAKRRKSVDDILPVYDVQLGLYGLVVKSMAAEWQIPGVVEGAYVYPADPSGDERSFREDFDGLLAHTRSWVGTGIELLRTRRFPRTPSVDDCTFCPFKPVCGVAPHERAAALLAGAAGALGELATLKGEGGDDE
jgi:PD-(D/E)XK nuclease superfamily protein